VKDVTLADLVPDGQIIEAGIQLDHTSGGAAKVARQLDSSDLARRGQ
jgi:hypothetical protein